MTRQSQIIWSLPYWAIESRPPREPECELDPERPRIEQIADPEWLLQVFRYRRYYAGDAPGPDGRAYSDYSITEMAECCRSVAAEILAGRYIPGPTRPVRWRKPNGGFRTLQIGNVIDRVVATSVLWSLHSVVTSWRQRRGYTPPKGLHRILSEIQFMIPARECWVFFSDDIRNCFPSLRIESAMASFEQILPDGAEVLDLIRRIIVGADDPQRAVGIQQGSPLSPMAMEVALNRILSHSRVCCWYGWRYVDNLFGATRTMREATDVLADMRSRLADEGLSLKGVDGPPVDFRRRGTTVSILGFNAGVRGGRVELALPETAWTALEEMLIQSGDEPNPAETARWVIRGWINAYAPALENVELGHFKDRLRQTARAAELRESAGNWGTAGVIDAACRRWLELRERVRQDFLHGSIR